MTIYVVEGNGPALMGRDWLLELPLDWQNIKKIQSPNVPKQNIEEHIANSGVFNKEIGKLKGVHAHLTVKEGAKPKFFKPRPIAFAVKEQVTEEINRLVKEGILEKVEYSEWAAPVVPVKKPDGKIRLW